MKIMDLNVNNFGGLYDAKPLWKNFRPLWEEYRVAMDVFQSDPQRVAAAEAIISAIENEAPDLIIFQEFDVNAHAGKEIARRLSTYYPVYPDKEESIPGNSSITIFFVKNDYVVDRYNSPGPDKKAWKWCGIGIGDLTICGVHFPDGMDYLDHVKRYAEKRADEKLLMIGDFNIAKNERRAKEIEEMLEKRTIKKKDRDDFFERRKWLLETMPAMGYSDAIPGEPITFFREGTTIDHVLVSPALSKVTAKVIPREVLQLSDHAVIIVDVDA